MSEQKIKSLTALLNSYPQSVGDLELGLRTYLAVCRDYTDWQVSRAVTQFLTGKVPRKNREFAPSCESFAVELEAESERERLDALRAQLEQGQASEPKYVRKPNHFLERWKRGEVEIAGPEARDRVRKMIGGGDASNG